MLVFLKLKVETKSHCLALKYVRNMTLQLVLQIIHLPKSKCGRQFNCEKKTVYLCWGVVGGVGRERNPNNSF